MVNESDIRDLLISTSSRLTSHREFLNLHSAELAPYFNVFDFITPNENRLSDIIAYFLDPKEGHGQGDVFLKSFLVHMELQGKFADLNYVSIRREQSTEKYRRIDIVIEQKEVFGIGIENKPWAKDQENQLSDYIAHLRDKKYKNNFICIYLSNEGRDPSEESISVDILEKVLENKELKMVSFNQLRNWVMVCRTVCQSDRVRGFLKDFESYIHQEFEGGSIMDIDKMIKEQVMSSDKNIEVALHIGNNIVDIKEALLEKLKIDIKNKLETDKLGLKLFDWKLKQWDREENDSVFSFRKDDAWKNYYICFGPDKNQLKNFFFGITKVDEKRPDIPDIEKYLNPLGLGEKSEWWPWYQYFEKPYDDWSSNVEPWIDIKNGKMVEIIIEKVKLLHEGLTKCAREEGIEL